MRAALRLFPVIFVAVAVLAALAGPASARQAFPAEGGRGDVSNPDECPRGWYVIGFKGRAGNWIDQISITCARFNADFSVAETRSLPARGGNGGGPSEITCPKGHVVQQASYYMTQEAKQVMQVNAQCRPLSGGKPTTITFGSKDTYDTKGFGVGDTRQTPRGGESCHAEEGATGFRINYGKHVNALGMICDELTLPKPVTQAATPPQGPGNWSAFASDSRGRWGFAVHQANVEAASKKAADGCGGSGAGCKVFWTTTDRCVSFAESRQGGYWYAAGGGPNEAEAKKKAIGFCQGGTAPANSCKNTGAWCRN